MIFGLALTLGASFALPGAHATTAPAVALTAAATPSWCAAPGVLEVWQQPWGTVETCIDHTVPLLPYPTAPAVATIGYWDTPTSSYIVVTVAECATLPYCSGEGLA